MASRRSENRWTLLVGFIVGAIFLRTYQGLHAAGVLLNPWNLALLLVGSVSCLYFIQWLLVFD